MSNMHSGTASCCFYGWCLLTLRGEESLEGEKKKMDDSNCYYCTVYFDFRFNATRLIYSFTTNLQVKRVYNTTNLVLFNFKMTFRVPLYPQFKLLPASCYIVAVKPQLLVQKIVSMEWYLICKIYILFLLIY